MVILMKPVNKMKNLFLTILSICFFVSSCAQENEIMKEDYKIISKIIDEFTYPLAPPPLIGSADTIIPKAKLDSLLRIKMVVAIDPAMESSINKKGSDDMAKTFESIIDTSLPSKIIKNIDEILSEKEHLVKLADTVDFKESYDFEQFDVLYNFSRIWYNKDETRAVFEVGISRSKLYGSSIIICLEKIDGEWSIIKSIPTTTW